MADGKYRETERLRKARARCMLIHKAVVLVSDQFHQK